MTFTTPVHVLHLIELSRPWILEQFQVVYISHKITMEEMWINRDKPDVRSLPVTN